VSNAIEVTAIRSGGWWAIEFATGAGIRYTQARRLDTSHFYSRLVKE